MNHLAGETSPYLLQHADNPVDWFPWGPEALGKSRREDKPILLSVGYSACHWCHVMAHESFEDGETAELMNRHFVNIKVDREERPDLDKIYQTAQLLLTQRSGGWPLTMFLTPDDQLPFFGGTYFPKQPLHNMPTFKEVLHRVHDYYQKHRGELNTQNQAMQEALGNIYAPSEDTAAPPPELQEQAAQALYKDFDPRHGGFGAAPKFPHPHYLELLLDHWARGKADGENRPQSVHVALFTLARMARGGLYDQLGGGFCRYSVDERWAIPHFEKMLYDNGPLLGLLAQAWSVSRDRLFYEKACETADWVMRRMQSPEGGYYSTLDADSEGEEGKYYVWEKREVENLLGADYATFAYCFGLDQPANFEGRWHLFEQHRASAAAEHLQSPPDEVRATLARARRTLLEHRRTRVPPGRDEKVLTSWNALMIKGMAQAAFALERPEYAASARRALAFIRGKMWDGKRLLATCRDGRAHVNAYLDDYAFLVDAVIHLNQAQWDSDALAFARQLADTLLEQYEDKDNGGFYFTSHDHEKLLQRVRTTTDEATPSGYGVAAAALGKLGAILGEEKYLRAAQRALEQAVFPMCRSPENHASLIRALAEQIAPAEVLIIRAADDALASCLQMAAAHYNPMRICFAIPAQAQNLPAAIADKTAPGASQQHAGGVRAYPCRGPTCDAPLDGLDALQTHLQASAVSMQAAGLSRKT